MTARLLVASLVVTLIACAPSDSPESAADPFSVTVPAFTLGNSDNAQKNFSAAPLKGRNEQPTPRDSKGTGQASFQLSKDGLSMSYKLNVTNLDGITQSHIHVGPIDDTGPVVVFLFGLVPSGVSSNGTLAEGTFTAANLVGPLAGGTLADLLAEMESGNAYVNVHTLAFPPGEIRGQIR